MNNPSSRADFNHPPRDYEVRKILGWELYIEKELLTTDAELASRAAKRLEAKLKEAQGCFPAKSRDVFKQLKFFLMGGKKMAGGGYDSGGEYHQKVAPQFFKYLDPRMASSIVIYSAENYVWQSDYWALKVLVHELAHAYQLEQWPENKQEIQEAWDHAKKEGLYKKVVRHDGVVLEEAYAISNGLEYFAELSCTYFCGSDYAPYNRTELKTYDPQGYAMIEELWGCKEKTSEESMRHL